MDLKLADLIRVAGAGHFVLEDEPETVVEALLD